MDRVSAAVDQHSVLFTGYIALSKTGVKEQQIQYSDRQVGQTMPVGVLFKMDNLSEDWKRQPGSDYFQVSIRIHERTVMCQAKKETKKRYHNTLAENTLFTEK